MMLLAEINIHSCLFVLFALLACGFAIAVAATNNVVRMAFYLTLCLGATSGLFFLAGSEFVGSMQLMIYVGGTLVLLIFGVMLTAQSRFVSMQTHAGEWVLAFFVGASLLSLLVASSLGVRDWGQQPGLDRAAVPLLDAHNSAALGLALSGPRVDQLDQKDPVLRAGMSGYLLPFVIVSMHLLVVLIGAGYMARTKRVGAGRLRERPIAAPRTDRRRNVVVSALLIFGAVINLVAAIKMFAVVPLRPMIAENKFGESITNLWKLVPPLDTAPQWAFVMLGLLFLANVLLLVVVWNWQKWGVIGLVVIPLIQAWVMSQAGFRPMDIGGNLAIGLLPVVLIIALLCTGKRPTMWEQME
ncbi:MAG: NADH-quinone oxidoreductase subunit J [Pirellulaceae bacterium]